MQWKKGNLFISNDKSSWICKTLYYKARQKNVIFPVTWPYFWAPTWKFLTAKSKAQIYLGTNCTSEIRNICLEKILEKERLFFGQVKTWHFSNSMIDFVCLTGFKTRPSTYQYYFSIVQQRGRLQPAGTPRLQTRTNLFPYNL